MPRRVLPLKPPAHTLQTAAAAFLDRPDLSPASRRSYTQTLQRLALAIGADRPLDALDGATVERATEHAWGRCAPATWNRHVATVRSFVAFRRRHCWVAEDVACSLDRRREPADRTRAIPRAELEHLWRREDASVRERAFWRPAGIDRYVIAAHRNALPADQWVQLGQARSEHAPLTMEAATKLYHLIALRADSASRRARHRRAARSPWGTGEWDADDEGLGQLRALGVLDAASPSFAASPDVRYSLGLDD